MAGSTNLVTASAKSINTGSLTESLMAKQLNVILDDHEHRPLLRVKGHQSWREFIMTLTKK
jgi:hypothetical protein